MLWYIVVGLLVLWLIGFLGLHILGAAIHVLLIFAVIVFVVALVKGL